MSSSRLLRQPEVPFHLVSLNPFKGSGRKAVLLTVGRGTGRPEAGFSEEPLHRAPVAAQRLATWRGLGGMGERG